MQELKFSHKKHWQWKLGKLSDLPVNRLLLQAFEDPQTDLGQMESLISTSLEDLKLQENQSNPLHLACFLGLTQVIPILAKYWNLNQKNINNYSPLDLLDKNLLDKLEQSPISSVTLVDSSLESVKVGTTSRLEKTGSVDKGIALFEKRKSMMESPSSPVKSSFEPVVVEKAVVEEAVVEQAVVEQPVEETPVEEPVQVVQEPQIVEQVTEKPPLSPQKSPTKSPQKSFTASPSTSTSSSPDKGLALFERRKKSAGSWDERGRYSHLINTDLSTTSTPIDPPNQETNLQKPLLTRKSTGIKIDTSPQLLRPVQPTPLSSNSLSRKQSLSDLRNKTPPNTPATPGTPASIYEGNVGSNSGLREPPPTPSTPLIPMAPPNTPLESDSPTKASLNKFKEMERELQRQSSCTSSPSVTSANSTSGTSGWIRVNGQFVKSPKKEQKSPIKEEVVVKEEVVPASSPIKEDAPPSPIKQVSQVKPIEEAPSSPVKLSPPASPIKESAPSSPTKLDSPSSNPPTLSGPIENSDDIIAAAAVALSKLSVQAKAPSLTQQPLNTPALVKKLTSFSSRIVVKDASRLIIDDQEERVERWKSPSRLGKPYDDIDDMGSSDGSSPLRMDTSPIQPLTSSQSSPVESSPIQRAESIPMQRAESSPMQRMDNSPVRMDSLPPMIPSQPIQTPPQPIVQESPLPSPPMSTLAQAWYDQQQELQARLKGVVQPPQGMILDRSSPQPRPQTALASTTSHVKDQVMDKWIQEGTGVAIGKILGVEFDCILPPDLDPCAIWFGVLYPTMKEEIGEFETGKRWVDFTQTVMPLEQVNVNGFLLRTHSKSISPSLRMYLESQDESKLQSMSKQLPRSSTSLAMTKINSFQVQDLIPESGVVVAEGSLPLVRGWMTNPGRICKDKIGMQVCVDVTITKTVDEVKTVSRPVMTTPSRAPSRLSSAMGWFKKKPQPQPQQPQMEQQQILTKKYVQEIHKYRLYANLLVQGLWIPAPLDSDFIQNGNGPRDWNEVEQWYQKIEMGQMFGAPNWVKRVKTLLDQDGL